MTAIPSPAGPGSPLWLSGFGAGFGNRVILAEVDLELPASGLHALMGPTGGGKSTLLRAICGIAQQSASFKFWGEMRYLGLVSGQAGWPSLVMQDARLFVSSVKQNLLEGLDGRSALTPGQQSAKVLAYLETMQCGWLKPLLETPVVELDLHDQRVVAILRQTLGQPNLLCVDEPTAGVDDDGAEQIMRLLKRWSREHCVLMVTHHQAQARQYADTVGLLASGRVLDWSAARDFFACPRSKAAQEFVNRGTCSSPRPDAVKEELDADFEVPPPLPMPARTAMSAWAGPSGFVWLEKGRLAGTPRPGVVKDLEADLDALQRVGVTRLLTLLEQPLDCGHELKARDMQAVHVAVADMMAPDHAQATAFCRQIDSWLAAGEVVAVHCHAGHGRTGTALAAWRIWRGQTAAEAIDSVRKIERRWIQSLEQVRFLESFAEHVSGHSHANDQ